MKISTLVIALCLIAALFILNACTVVRYQSADRSLTVIDLHPGGETLSLQGTLDSIGTLEVNRDTQDSAEIVSAVVDAAVGL